jgi:hypothetical protein
MQRSRAVLRTIMLKTVAWDTSPGLRKFLREYPWTAAALDIIRLSCFVPPTDRDSLLSEKATIR